MSSETNQVSISGINHIFYHTNDQWYVDNICGSAFKHIEFIN